MESPRVRLGELLARAGLITEEQLEEALREQARVGKRLGSLLVELGLVSETQVTQILSQQLSVPWVSLHHIDFSRELLDRVPMDLVERFCLIPIYVRRVRGLGDALYVAMDDPTNGQALAQVAQSSGLHVRAMIAPPSDIKAAIRAYYGVGDEPEAPPLSVIADSDEDDDDLATGIHSRSELAPPVVPEPGVSAPAVPEPVVPAEPPAVPPPPVSAPVAPSSPPARPSASPSATVAERPGGPAAPRAPSSRPAPVAERRSAPRAPAAPAGAAPRRMIALTLLDGTTIQLPAKGRAAGAAATGRDDAEPASDQDADQLRARDLVAALRAQVHGADASEILGENVRWEAMFAALLALLLKKNLIADWEFVEEFKKI